MLVRNRKGEDETGEDSTRTRCAEGVVWGASMLLSKSRQCRFRVNVYAAFPIEKYVNRWTLRVACENYQYVFKDLFDS
jgi:hypothetical protein